MTHPLCSMGCGQPAAIARDSRYPSYRRYRKTCGSTSCLSKAYGKRADPSEQLEPEGRIYPYDPAEAAKDIPGGDLSAREIDRLINARERSTWGFESAHERADRLTGPGGPTVGA